MHARLCLKLKLTNSVWNGLANAIYPNNQHHDFDAVSNQPDSCILTAAMVHACVPILWWYEMLQNLLKKLQKASFCSHHPRNTFKMKT